jgi:hypothetical protein
MPRVSRTTAQTLGIAAAGAVSGTAILAIVQVAGPLALALPVGAIVAWYLVQHPAAAVGAFVAAAVLLEADSEGIFGFGARTYEPVVGSVNAKPLDFALALLIVLALTRRDTSRRPLPLTAPLMLATVALTGAVVAGVMTGFVNGSGPSAMISPLRQLVYLGAIPLVVVTLVRTEADVRLLAKGAVVLALLKAAAGTAASILGEGPSLSGFAPGSLSLSYYESGTPFFLLFFLMALAAAALTGLRLPTWARVGAGLSLSALLLSFRRSFWLGGIAGFVVLIVATSGKRPRWRSMAVTAVAIGAIVGLSLSVGALPSSDNVVLRRAQELTALTGNNKGIGDQYRVAERRNALENLERHPITGLGVGVGWTEYERLPTVFGTGRQYVHSTVLWFWLKLGLLGVVAYLLFMAAGIHAGWRVWKRHSDPTFRMAGLGAVAAVVGLVVAETTASFTGVEPRVTVIFGAMLGWLIAADAVEAR